MILSQIKKKNVVMKRFYQHNEKLYVYHHNNILPWKIFLIKGNFFLKSNDRKFASGINCFATSTVISYL